MKKNLTIIALVLLIIIAAKPKGEVVGASSKTLFERVFQEENPYGMVYVKAGSFMMGPNDQSPFGQVNDAPINVTVDAFWMDETEITNDEYRQFVYWVRDSVAMRTILMSDEIEDRVRAKYTTLKLKSGDDLKNYSPEQLALNWKLSPWASKDSVVKRILSPFYFQFAGKKQINTSLLVYSYEWLNYDQAALPQNKFNVKTGRYPNGVLVTVDSSFYRNGEIIDTTVRHPLREHRDLLSKGIVTVYPDTMVWLRDFQYAYNDPKMNMYFSHPGFKDYPVVGVTWEQAQAFCHWRTQLFNSNHKVGGQEYRLPTEAEWEYAARGGKQLALYPWGGNYVLDNQNCFMANFKPMRGSFTDDDGSTTMQVASYPYPNDYGLYDMAGNVAEWTSTAYVSSTNNLVSQMNPNFQYNARVKDKSILKRKVVKGGSWKDIAYYLQCGARTYEYQYESRTYIGFRCVRSYNGTVPSYVNMRRRTGP